LRIGIGYELNDVSEIGLLIHILLLAGLLQTVIKI